MSGRFREHRELILLLMLLLLMVMHPLLDHGTPQRLVLAGLMLLTLIVATVTVSQKESWFWAPLLLLVAAVVFGLAATFTKHWAFAATQWATLVLLFGVIVGGLFSYLRSAREVTGAHLYTAATIYLLLAMLWFALYNLMEVLSPGSFMQGTSALADPRSELLYFSLVTLTTVGYGDIVPVAGVVRMLAALEAGAGVLYVAITVAVLVSAHKRREP